MKERPGKPKAPPTPMPRAGGGAFAWDSFSASVPAFVFLLSRDGRYEYASRRVGAGVPVEASGKIVEDVLPPAQSDLVRSLMNRVSSGERHASAEVVFLDAARRPRRCFVSLSAYFTGGDFVGFSGLCVDVTGQPDEAPALDERSVALAELLTPKQREVLILVAEGLSTREIARRLGVGERTVETHREQIGERLGVRGAAAFARFAIQSGLV